MQGVDPLEWGAAMGIFGLMKDREGRSYEAPGGVFGLGSQWLGGNPAQAFVGQQVRPSYWKPTPESTGAGAVGITLTPPGPFSVLRLLKSLPTNP